MAKINNLCYCQSPLIKYNNPCDGRTCVNCCQEIPDDDQHVYAHLTKPCLYQTVSNQQYVTCTDCYQCADDDGVISSYSNSTFFLITKFTHSLNKISLVYSMYSKFFLTSQFK